MGKSKNRERGETYKRGIWKNLVKMGKSKNRERGETYKRRI